MNRDTATKSPFAVAPRAKLAAPATLHLLRRQRLFDWLDRASAFPIVWVHGPPGSGKTSLLATYLEARELPYIWYRFDGMDDDPAVVMRLLAEALSSNSTSKALLPVFPGHAPYDVDSVYRQFFVQFYASLPAGTAIVLDDFSANVPTQMRSLVIHALASVPQGMRIFVTSQSSLTDDMVLRIGDQPITSLGWPQLRLTKAETAELVAASGANIASVDDLHRQSDGHVTALRLRLASGNLDDPTASGTEPDNTLSLLFERAIVQLPDRVQRFLLTTALLPEFTVALVHALTAESDVDGVIESLQQYNFFTHTRIVATAHNVLSTYSYHSLFRAFLITRSRQQLGDTAYLALVQRTSELLAEHGYLADAIDLALQHNAPANAAALIAQCASSTYARGELLRLRSWFERLPESAIADEPWLLYWYAMTLALYDEDASRHRFEQAYTQFHDTRNSTGELLCASAMLAAMDIAWSTFAGAPVWLERALSAYERLPDRIEPEVELRALIGLVSACWMLNPHDQRLQSAAERVIVLLAADVDCNARVAAATVLASFIDALGRHEWQATIDSAFDALSGRPDLHAFVEANWLYWRASRAQLDLDTTLADRLCDQAETIAKQHGFATILFNIGVMRTDSCITQGNVSKARSVFQQVAPFFDPARLRDAATFHYKSAQLALMGEQWREALHHAELCVETLQRAECPRFLLAMYRQQQMNARLMTGDTDGALTAVDLMLKDAPPAYAPEYKCYRLLIRAHGAVTNNTGDAVKHLAAGFAALSACHPFPFFRSNPRAAQTLCAAAMEAAVEVPFVEEVIRKRQFHAPSPHTDRWPWRVKIHALGGFRILLDGKALVTEGKTQRKPLELLKALIANGGAVAGGSGVDATTLIDQVWPNLEADDPKSSFDVALSRLRKLLGVDGVLIMHDGRLSLNRELAWCDAPSFESLGENLLQELREGNHLNAGAIANTLFRIYQGPLLAGEDKLIWCAAPRERLAARFINAISAYGEFLEAQQQWRDAAALYQRGIDQDMLAEALYRGAMRCQLQLLQPVEALRIYRRCRECLSIVLGVKPSPETEALHRTISLTQ